MVNKFQKNINPLFQIIDTSTKTIDYPANIFILFWKIIDTSTENIDTSAENIDTSTENIDTSAENIDTSTEIINYSNNGYDHFLIILSKIRGCRNRSDTYVL